MKHFLNIVLVELGLKYEPEHAVGNPFGHVRTLEKQPIIKEPDNIRFHHGQQWTKVDRLDGFEEEIFTGKSGHVSNQLTKQDKEKLIERGLSVHKANELKPVFAAGASATEAAKTYNKKRGYKLRTLEKYWSAFNASFREELTPV